MDEDSIEAAQNLTQEDVFGEDLSESSDEEGERRRQQMDGSINEIQVKIKIVIDSWSDENNEFL